MLWVKGKMTKASIDREKQKSLDRARYYFSVNL